MATIKDIAQSVGVSHATVSNVLNHKGNVSAKKVKIVMDAAHALGYRVNEAASSLRSGATHTLAVIMPDDRICAYGEMYQALAQTAEERGYGTLLRLTDNLSGNEQKAVADVLSSRARCVLVVTSLPEPAKCYAPLVQADMRVLFALRGAPDGFFHAGFDMKKAAEDMAAQIKNEKPLRVGLMTGMTCYPTENTFTQTFLAAMQTADISVTHLQSIPAQYTRQAFVMLGQDTPPEVVMTTSAEMAEAVRRVGQYLSRLPRIYTLSQARMPADAGYAAYQLNFKRLGRDAALALINDAAPLQNINGQVIGFPMPSSTAFKRKAALSMLSADTPVTRALLCMLPRLEKETGISLRMTLKPTQEVSGAFAEPQLHQTFDIIRMDMALLNRWARPLLLPLEETNFALSDCIGRFLPKLETEYSLIDGMHYALPFDPGCCLLFFREDLINDPHLQRVFYEKKRRMLRVPQTREEYLEAAVFMDSISRQASEAWRGTLVTRRASEYISDLLAFSSTGKWPQLSGEMLQSYIEQRRMLEQSAAIVPGGSWNQAVNRFSHGESALMVAHGNYAGRLTEEPLSRVSGQVGYAPAPGGRPLLSGGVLGILKKGGHKEAAVDFLSWLFMPNTAELLALLGGCSPLRSAYENEDILALYPWLNAVRTGLQNGIRRQLFPCLSADFDQLSVEKQIAGICANAVQGSLPPDAAAEAINRQVWTQKER